MAQPPYDPQQPAGYSHQSSQGQPLNNQIPYGQQGYPQPYYAAPHQTRKGLPGWAWVLIIVPLVLVGTCVGVSFFVTAATKTAVQTAATAVASDPSNGNSDLSGGKIGPADKVTPLVRALSATPACTFTYANLQFSVKTATISNQVSDNPPQYRADAAHLDMTLSVTNPTSDSIRVSSGLLQVILGDGTVLKQPIEMRVDAQDTQESKLSFSVAPTSTWDRAQLSLSEVGKEPAMLPLDGPVPAAQYPVQLTAGGKASLTDPHADFNITHATLDVDAFGLRILTGKRYLILTIHVVAHEENGVLVSADSFRLDATGKPIAPDNISPVAEALGNETAKDFQVAFVVPAGVKTATLTVGEQDKENSNISLDLTPAKS